MIVLLKELTRVVVKYALSQVQSGAHVVQIFEAIGMMIKYNNNYDGEEGKMFD